VAVDRIVAKHLVTRFAQLKKPVYYILGNHDEPLALTGENGGLVESEFYVQLGQAGAVRLDAPIKLGVARSENAVWLWPLELINIGYDQAKTELSALDADDSRDFSDQLLRRQYEGVIQALDGMQVKDVMIALTHHPLTPQKVQSYYQRIDSAQEVLGRIDLVLAGHYHKGQWRLPLIGAVYVPSSDLGINGFFPGNTYVYGMMDVEGVKQYVSGGLGSAGSAPMRFRLLATPEATLIKLTSSVALK
jgi:predicted MPP superfamily phosphohydrolase